MVPPMLGAPSRGLPGVSRRGLWTFSQMIIKRGARSLRRVFLDGEPPVIVAGELSGLTMVLHGPSMQLGSTMVNVLSTARASQQELADATRHDLPRTSIAVLAQSRSGCVREVIAHRDDVPFGVQAALSNDDMYEVRVAIAANPRTAVSVMHHLAADSHHCVLLALASNASVPEEVAQTLARNRRADVRTAAIRRLDTREAPQVAPIRDADARIPELRDRVDHAPEPVPDVTRWGFGEEVDFPEGATLSRLALRITTGQLVTSSREGHLAPSSDLCAAAAS